MNLATEEEKPFLFDELMKGFSKINIDLEKDDINNFVTTDNETTEEYSESVLKKLKRQTVKLILKTCFELKRIILNLMKNIF